MTLIATLLCSLALSSVHSLGNSLSLDYYEKTCPGAEAAITNAIRNAVAKDKTVPAAIIRMHFHDCFIRGCDASVLLDSTIKNTAEKAGSPNRSLHTLYAIDNAKEAVEAVCPGVVSCADVLAIAARDVIVLSGGPRWDVPKGRKDGRISRASETGLLPGPTFNLSQLQQNFSQSGLGLEDLVALSGGHTLGFAHCSSFNNRIHKFDSTHDIDPTMEASLAASLRSVCPLHHRAKKAGAKMNPSPTTFDNTYFQLLLQGKSLFSSDQALLTSATTKNLVYKFATSQETFYEAFVKSMIKMGSVTGGQEVRKNCRMVN